MHMGLKQRCFNEYVDLKSVCHSFGKTFIQSEKMNNPRHSLLHSRPIRRHDTQLNAIQHNNK
jgi:hypothetical protein